MEMTIRAKPKEIAALVLEVQRRQGADELKPVRLEPGMSLVLNGRQLFCQLCDLPYCIVKRRNCNSSSVVRT